MNELENETLETNGGQKSNSMIWVIGIVVVALIGLLLFKNMQNKGADSMEKMPAAGGQETQMQAPTGTTAPADGQTMQGETMMMEGGTTDQTAVKTIKMEMGSFYYTPSTFSVKKGQKVRIELTSKDMMHDFNIDQLGVKSPIVKAGESAVVEFVADQVGEFEYYCSVGQHRKNGQVGTLIVEE